MKFDRNKRKSKSTSKKFSLNVKIAATLYLNEFKKYGYSLDSLMWPKGAQDARFKSKFDIGVLTNARILDVGCGFGHMLDYLHAWNINAQYTGIDICPDFIEIAKQRHPSADFRVLNILDNPMDETWDWVFSVGTLNVTSEKDRWWPYVKAMIRRMYDLCAQGVAVDLFSTYVDFQKEKVFHAKPEKVFSFAKTLTRRVVIRHDYMAYEFTLYLYKDQAVTNNNTFLDFKKMVLPEPKI
ncbi:MAG: class I SAM-dependent methyltransferase [Proteobacteria bacterium]|nr:class I SAM-dependent methyltransferase [Pseudomonadota bacterium]